VVKPSFKRDACSALPGVLLLVMLVLAAPAAMPSAARAAVAGAGAIPGTNGAPVPELDWGTCPAATPEEERALRAYECTTAEVPLSYRDPQGQSVELALGRLPATDRAHRLGTLFWNPGGPGGPGRIPPAFSAKLHARFDIVGFDPRGVGASTRLRCFETNQEALGLFLWQFPITLAQERRAVDLARRATQQCARNGGPILEHMATGNVARDIDLLRQAVGDQKLTYLGFSYGTHIGEVYANLFPDRVRALTLDGVIDPVEWTTGATPADAYVPIEFRAGSFRGTYQALLTFLDACAHDRRCAFREQGRNLLQKYDTLLRRLRRRPVLLIDPDGSPVVVTYQLAVYYTLGQLHAASNSSELAAVLQEAWLATERRSGARAPRIGRRLPAIVRPTHPRQTPDDEPYIGIGATTAVECTDSTNPSNPWVWPRYARRADRAAPYFGSAWVYSSLFCATWPAVDPDRYTGPWNRPTANPVLLIGNRKGDPGTPYEDAVSTSRELANARLLTLDGFGHTAFRDSQCIVAAVERYLIALALPPRGTVCQPDRGPFDPVPDAVARKQRPLDDALAPTADRAVASASASALR
jgi:pimeloyl-ACP methyl ester carboxylesterase